MPNIKCICESRIGFGGIPNPNEYLLISDVKFEKFWDSPNTEQLYNEMSIVGKCSNCGRLHVFWDGFDKPQTIYKIDES